MNTSDAERLSLVPRIYNINAKDFEGVAMEVWRYQYLYNGLYRSYCHLLGITDQAVKSVGDIPFLPIGMFRDHEVTTTSWMAEKTFKSSGTTGTSPSRHLVRDISFYHLIAEKCFEVHFGSAAAYSWLGLLPSYLDRPDSSLIDMVNYFMQRSGSGQNGFYSQPDASMIEILQELQERDAPAILIGVSFALLDLFQHHAIPIWNNLNIIETGGMKGRGTEITRDELYQRIRKNHPGIRISSEYGMTELMSQAYMVKDHFVPGPAMKVLIRDISDPLQLCGYHQRGAINIIDLANLDTCAFIATDDLGIGYEDGSFDVLGRLDNSDLRGCNLMYT